jgi:hypothetical protein
MRLFDSVSSLLLYMLAILVNIQYIIDWLQCIIIHSSIYIILYTMAIITYNDISNYTMTYLKVHYML